MYDDDDDMTILAIDSKRPYREIKKTVENNNKQQFHAKYLLDVIYNV